MMQTSSRRFSQGIVVFGILVLLALIISLDKTTPAQATPLQVPPASVYVCDPNITAQSCQKQ